MNTTIDLERRLATWLEQDGPAAVPAVAVEAALAQARTVRQRRAWLTRTWWDRQPLVAAHAGVEAGVIEPAEQIPTLPVAGPPLRQAWVIVLLAALLAALVGGALVAGSQLRRLFPAVVPPIDQLYECPPGSTPDEPGPVDQARPPIFYIYEQIVFDRRAGRLVAVTGPATWTFDVCTNTWTQMHPDREPPEIPTGQLVYDVDSDLTIGVAYGPDGNPPGKVWAYDLGANTWTEKGVAPAGAALRAYDPVSGLVVAASNGVEVPGDVWTYDVDTDTWTQIRQANRPRWGYGLFAYDASVDRMVMYTWTYSGYEMWLIDIRTGTWSLTPAATPPEFNTGFYALQPSIVYDEATERTVFSDGRRLAAYDATADRWEILAAADPSRAVGFQLHAVYDPLNGRLVGPADMAGVVAFDPGTREWTVLLEASEGRPVPSSN